MTIDVFFNDWRATTLGECGRWLSGGTPSKNSADFWNGDIPWISAKSMHSTRISDSDERVTAKGAENGTKRVPDKTILILVRGSILLQCVPLGITTREVTFNQDVKAVITAPHVMPEFLLYWLLANEPVLLNMVEYTGIGAGKLSSDRLLGMEVKLPPLSEQRAIAHILSTLDDKIELNQQMNRNLEAIAQAIFKSWFVNFEPIRAKLEGHQPVGMGAAIAAFFPDSLEESQIGEIPKGWEIKTLDRVANFLNGLALQKYPSTGDKYLPVIKIAELRRGVTESSGRASPDIKNDYVVEDGDILFSWSGSLEVCIWCGGIGALNQHLFKVTSAEYPKWFYYQWIKYYLPNFQAIAASKATTMGHIQRHHLTEAQVLVPPVDTLQMMDKRMAPLLNQFVSNNLESRTLTAIRDALLPKLVSSEIRVKDAEKLMEVVV